MDIIEISWIKENKGMISVSDLETLAEYDFFDQLETGQFSMKFRKFLDMLKDVIDIYEKYNPVQ